MIKNGKKSVLIFGLTGFFASNLIKKLENFSVIGVSRHKQPHLDGVKKVFKYNDFLDIKNHAPFDFVLDFSSKISVEEFVRSPLKTFTENVEIPLRHLSLLREINFDGHYIYITSDRAIAPNKNQDILNNIKIKNDPYGASKLFSELLIHYSLGLSETKTTMLRFPNLYGVGQKSGQLLPTIFNKISEGTLNIRINSFKGNRNYLHVEDATDAILNFIQRPLEKDELCISGENIEITYILENIKIMFNKLTGDELNFFEKKNADRRNLFLLPPKVLDDQIFRQSYNWKPRVKIEQGLLELLQNGVNNAS